jgi:ankyrin repeat protein
MDGSVYATLSVTFLDQEDQDVEGTALHWACSNDYLDVVQLLLQYDNVDVCSTDIHAKEPIHYAARNGHTESYYSF